METGHRIRYLIVLNSKLKLRLIGSVHVFLERWIYLVKFPFPWFLVVMGISMVCLAHTAVARVLFLRNHSEARKLSASRCKEGKRLEEGIPSLCPTVFLSVPRNTHALKRLKTAQRKTKDLNWNRTAVQATICISRQPRKLPPKTKGITLSEKKVGIQDLLTFTGSKIHSKFSSVQRSP